MKNLGLVLSVLAGCAAPALAQDSVSATPGLPGDALECDVVGTQQRSAYVVDLVPMFGSWNTRWGIAPVMKLSSTTGNFRSTTGGQFFTASGSACGMSQTFRTNMPYPMSSYSLWTTAGGGVHPTRNSSGSTVNPTGTSTQFGIISAEFGTNPANASVNNIVGAVVNFDPANPSRLFVTRTVAAVNTTPSQTGDSSQFGVGSVDAAGNVYFRVDAFNSTASNKIVGDNTFRVRTLPIPGFSGRNASTLNLIDVSGGSDSAATDWVARNQTVTYGPPAAIPNELATTLRGALFGGNGTSGAGQLFYSNTASTFTTTTAHRPGTTDHRGNMAFTPVKLRGASTVGTGATLVKIGATATDGISIWGVNADGSPTNAVTLAVPRGSASTTIADPCANLSAPQNIDWDIGQGDFRNYQGSAFARGGNGQVAMGKDQAGRGMIAAVVFGNQSLSGTPPLPVSNSPHNAIAVARFDTANPAAATWRIAAWTNPSAAFTPAAGKAIYGDYGNDGLPFTNDAGEFDGQVDLDPNSPTFDAPIGNLVPAFERTGGSPFGGSISSPVIDSVGNVYFVATAALYKSGGTDYDTCLFKAVYDPTNFCYRLELMLELGKTFTGANSGTRYSMRFLNLQANNSTPAPAGLWSNGGSSQAWNNMDPSGLAVTDAKTLGGLVLSAGITYDSDNDSTFGSAGDEQYNVILYISNMTAEAPSCPADFNGDGFVDGFDYDDFVACFEGDPCPPGKTADFNGDGFPDGFDYDDFVAAFETGCL